MYLHFPLQPLMNFRFFSLKVSGLLGGHSGVDIHLPRANANVLIARIMNRIRCEFDCWITSWNGGTKDNAIPRESEITFAVKTANSDKLQILYQEEIVHIKEYYHNLKSDRILEPTLAIEMKETAPGLCVDEKTSHNILSITNLIPNGPLKISPTLPQLVETSSNFALVKMDDKEIQITSLLRSSIDHELVALRNVFWSLSEIGAWQIHHKDAYPGWAPDPNAPFTKFVQKQYEELLQQPVKLEVIHAGLECGLIGSKIKNLQMLSIGPTIKYPHSPSERVNIASVNQIYTLLKRIISRFSIFA